MTLSDEELREIEAFSTSQRFSTLAARSCMRSLIADVRRLRALVEKQVQVYSEAMDDLDDTEKQRDAAQALADDSAKRLKLAEDVCKAAEAFVYTDDDAGSDVTYAAFKKAVEAWRKGSGK